MKPKSTKKRSVAPKAGDAVRITKVPASLGFLKGREAKIEKKSKQDYTLNVNGGLLVFSQSEIRKGTFKLKVLPAPKPLIVLDMSGSVAG